MHIRRQLWPVTMKEWNTQALLKVSDHREAVPFVILVSRSTHSAGRIQ